MLKVNEVFATVQGEAGFTGTPSVFVRLQGCPVGCPWCDTKHTWAVDVVDEVSIPAMLAKTADAPTWATMSPEQVLLVAEELSAAKHVVITGGEPAMYDLQPVSTYLIDSGYTVQVETSGTHALSIDPRAWVTVSPKVKMPGGFAVLPEVLARADEIKHPVGRMRDIDNLRELLGDRPHPIVWLQPLSQSKAATRKCMEQATENGWRVSVQVHKYLGVR